MTGARPLSRYRDGIREWCFEVRVLGFDYVARLWASSRGQALYRAWRMACGAGYYTSEYGGLVAFSKAARVRAVKEEAHAEIH